MSQSHCRTCGDPLPITVTRGNLCHGCRPRGKRGPRDLVDDLAGQGRQPEGCDACSGSGVAYYVGRFGRVAEACAACDGTGRLQEGM